MCMPATATQLHSYTTFSEALCHSYQVAMLFICSILYAQLLLPHPSRDGAILIIITDNTGLIRTYIQ